MQPDRQLAQRVARNRVLADGGELAESMRERGASLKAAVLNRVHPLPEATGELGLHEALRHAPFSGETVPWLEKTATAARTQADDERLRLDRLEASLPASAAIVEVPELDHDAHSPGDLAAVARLFLSASRR
jgi:hypothetical protein